LLASATAAVSLLRETLSSKSRRADCGTFAAQNGGNWHIAPISALTDSAAIEG
jgi:hypothetical protein